MIQRRAGLGGNEKKERKTAALVPYVGMIKTQDG